MFTTGTPMMNPLLSPGGSSSVFAGYSSPTGGASSVSSITQGKKTHFYLLLLVNCD